MKKSMYYLSLILLSLYVLSNDFNDKNLINNDHPQLINFDYNEQDLINQGFIPITNFLELASIGRTEKFPADRNYFLANDIVLPYVAHYRNNVISGNIFRNRELEEYEEYEIRMKQDLLELIPDYFWRREGEHDFIRGWKPIPNFSGIFDGRGRTIYGLAGNRLTFARSPYFPNENDMVRYNPMNGLFGRVTGTIRHLNVEVGQQFRLRTVLADGPGLSIYRAGVAHLNAIRDVGAIAAILDGGTIEYSYSSARSQFNLHFQGNDTTTAIYQSEMRASWSAMGGLVARVNNGGIIRHSGSSVQLRGVRRDDNNAPSVAAGNVEGDHIGGLVGELNNNSIIEYSFSTGWLMHAARRPGAFVSSIHNGGTIRNSFTTSEIRRTSTHATANLAMHAAAGFVHSILGYGSVEIYNSFTTVSMSNNHITGAGTGQLGHTSARGYHDTFIVYGAHRATLTNVVATAPLTPVASRHALELTRDQLSDSVLIDNFINMDKTIFHIYEDNNYPTFNPNPQPIERTTIYTSGRTLRYVNGVDVFGVWSDDRPIQLTKGNFELVFDVNGIETVVDLDITIEDVTYGQINMWNVRFYDENNTFIEELLFRSGSSISAIVPPNPGRLFAGWHSSQFEGELVEIITSNQSVWAVFYNVMIYGTTIPDAEIILTAHELLDNNISFEEIYLTADSNGDFIIVNIPQGTFILTIRMDGFIDIVREFIVDAEPIVYIEDLLHFYEVMLYGQTRQGTVLTLTNIHGNLIGEIRAIDGNFIFSQILDGQYFLTIASNGFVTYTKSIYVNRQSIDLLFIELVPVTISGTARPNTIVQLRHNEIVIHTITVLADGGFIFSAIHTGTIIGNTVFEIIAILETFDREVHSIHIQGNASVIHNFIQEELVTISGVTSLRATITLMEDGNVINSKSVNRFGEFRFTGIRNGNFILMIERPRFETVMIPVTIGYMSYDIQLTLLDRLPSTNANLGITAQIFIVGLIGTSIWLILFKRKNNETTY